MSSYESTPDHREPHGSEAAEPESRLIINTRTTPAPDVKPSEEEKPELRIRTRTKPAADIYTSTLERTGEELTDRLTRSAGVAAVGGAEQPGSQLRIRTRTKPAPDVHPSKEEKPELRIRTRTKPAPDKEAKRGAERFEFLVPENEIADNVEYLESLQDLAAEAGSFRTLLGGESFVSDAPEGQRVIPEGRTLKKLGIFSSTVIHKAISGADYESLQRDNPYDRYKFYSSFDLTTPEKVDLGTEWFSRVAQAAHSRELSLTVKKSEHAYDSLNLYTWHPEELAAIVQELYPEFEERGLYHETPHFFQGEIEGINPDHVGFVQEPIAGYSPITGQSTGSHSARMLKLGRNIDSGLAEGRDLDKTLFTEAAQKAGVNPLHPYMLAR